MLQDDRTKAEKMVGLLGIDGYMQKELAANPPPAMRPNAEAPSPLSMLDQMDERHGKLKSRLGLFSHLYNGGSRSDYGDEDMLAAQKSRQAQQAMQDKMGMAQPLIEMMQSNDPRQKMEAMYGLDQLGFDKDMIGMMPGMQSAGQKPATYTEGDYQKINGRWNLVQQANDGSVKYTEMGENFTPTNRMMSPDSLQSGLQEYQTASFGAAQNEEDLDSIINTMDELGEENWGATGFAGEVGEKWKELTGTEDATTMARKTYDKIRTTRAIQNLPPGVASDKDIELVMKPFPKGTMNYQELRKYMEQLKRGEQKIREYNNFSSRYLSNKGKRDGMVEAWDSHWDEMTSEGGKFYEEKGQESGGQGQKYDGPTDFTGGSWTDFDALEGKVPSGTIIIDPDGKKWRTP